MSDRRDAVGPTAADTYRDTRPCVRKALGSPLMSAQDSPTLPPSDSSKVVERARFEGVFRPFQILCRMATGLRSELAQSLGVAFRKPGEAIGESWEIIHRDRLGLQARTHLLHETMSPLARNNNWSEILLRTAARLRVPVDPSMPAWRIEKAIFEHLSKSFVSTLGAEGEKAVDELSERAPALAYCLATTGVSSNGIRMILAGILRETSRASWKTADGVLRAADWINERVSKGVWTPSVSRGLSAVRSLLREAFLGWRESGLCEQILRGQERRTVPVIAAIYLESAVDENLEELKLMPEGC